MSALGVRDRASFVRLSMCTLMLTCVLVVAVLRTNGQVRREREEGGRVGVVGVSCCTACVGVASSVTVR